MRLFVLCVLFMPIWLAAQEPSKGEASEIRALLDRQENSWNEGDIQGFMEGYWKDEKLMFVGKNGPTYGWEATLKRYQQSYPDRASMGTLVFEVLQMEKLGPKAVFVLGKWELKREKGDIGGHFTLIWKKIEGEWVIVSDHSS